MAAMKIREETGSNGPLFYASRTGNRVEHQDLRRRFRRFGDLESAGNEICAAQLAKAAAIR